MYEQKEIKTAVKICVNTKCSLKDYETHFSFTSRKASRIKHSTEVDCIKNL